MVVFGFPDGSRLIWLGGSHVVAKANDPARRLVLQADAIAAIARAGDHDETSVRAALEKDLDGARVIVDGDLRRYLT